MPAVPMTTVSVARALVALLLVGIGLVCWSAAGVADQLAVRHERLATFQGIDPAPEAWWRTSLERVLDPGKTPTFFTSADYWAGRYDATRNARSNTYPPCAPNAPRRSSSSAAAPPIGS